MSKLSKRAITLFVIATMILSILSAFIAVPVMAAALTGVSVLADPLTAGEPSDYQVFFTTVGEIAATTGTITITFPAEYDLSLLVPGDVSIGVGAGYPSYTPTSIVIGAGTVTITAGAISIPSLSPVLVNIFGMKVKNPTIPADYIINIATSAPDTGSDTVTIVLGDAVTLTVEGIKDPFEINTDSGVTVTALDQYGNTATGYTGTIAFTSTAGGVLPIDYTFLVGDAGVKVFDGVSVGEIVTLVTIGEFSVTATDTVTFITGSQTAISVYVSETSEFSIDFVTPGNVDYGDVLTVIGSGVTGGSAVDIYWDLVTAANKLNATTGKGSGEFECTVKVPSAYYGNHYIWVKDIASGISKRSDAIPVVSKIKLSPKSGLKTDDITIKGYGFAKDSKIDIDLLDPILGLLSNDGGLDVDETDDLGYFEYIFEVDATVDGSYEVTATDAATHSTSATFTVGAAISIDKEVGPAGTIVKVEGRGFGETLVALVITMDGVPVSTKDGGEVTVPASGLFTAYIVIPSVSKGEHEITILDGADPVTATFEVDGETSITVTPGYGTPGTVLTVKGYNFTRISGTEVVLAIEDQTAETTTDASGSFTATIIVPPLDFGVRYPVIANDTRLCNAEDEVLVALIVLQLSKYSAPVGSEVMLMGSGFTKGAEDGEWNATIGDIDLIETTPIGSAVTYFSYYWYVPSLPTGTYTINVLDLKEEIEVGIDFTITDPAALSVSRASIPNGYNLTLEGTNFVELADQETEWWIYNSTDAWNIDDNVTQGESLPISPVPVTDEDGEIISWYMIPEFLELGLYTINCTTVSNDQVDPYIIQTAEVDIELVPEEIIINVGGPSYARGQTITFVIKTTLKKDPFDLGIKDPEGSEVFNSTWHVIDWKTLGTWFYIPSNLQVDKNTDWLYTLPADAMPGTWTYSLWDDEKEYANGTFQVTQLTEIEQLQQDIGEIIAGIEGMGASNTELAALVADLQGASAEAVAAAAAAAAAAGDAQTAAEAAMAAISDVDDTAGAALVAANDAKDAADRAKDSADAGLQAALDALVKAQESVDAANDARESADANQKTTSGLTGLVYGAIGASLIAALAAIVSLMQISRRIAG